MIIYEVNLAIDKDIYAEFQLWLKSHAEEMIQFQGFIQASILKQEGEKLFEQEKLTVQYQLENRKALDEYLEIYAPTMRQKGINLFKDKFSAERSVFEVKEIILK